jgi:hypothetical protein
MRLAVRISLALLPIAACMGCVERILQVRTEPARAAITVNGEDAGATGTDGVLEHPFTFYGTVDVTARASGHLSRRELVTLAPPWYQLFPVDFFAEIVVPWTIRDVHSVELRLDPSPARMDEGLRESLRREAEELRSKLPPPLPGRGAGAGGS